MPYLKELGVKTIYASPFFDAVPGSEHGYDVTDPLNINPEIGTLEEFEKIHQKLRSMGIGWIQDIVPNHMAFSVHNPWIRDVLEKGRKSAFSDFFDIDWDHPNEQLNGKLMLPVLGKPLGELIETGEILVTLNSGNFVLKYYENEFPLNYDSYLLIIDNIIKGSLTGDSNKYKGIIDIVTNKAETGGKGKELFSEKCLSDKNFRDYINENLKIINRDVNILKELVQVQHFVPVCWKETDKILNYRRFFTINGLICLKIERKNVFEVYHSLVNKFCKENLFQGLRIDHIDGLFNPGEYLDRLRELAGSDKYLIVEKILYKDEYLERNWPVQGETGYHFLSLVNNLLTNKSNYKNIEKIYHYWNISKTRYFKEILYRRKRFILLRYMSGDLDNLCNYFLSLNITGSGSYNHEGIKNAIGEFLVCCPVYKIYGNPGNFNKKQLALLNNTFDIALTRSPDISDELLLLKKILLEGKELFSNKGEEIDALFRRFMQFTGPLMAKGGEDTAFYTYNRFIAHNEVGDSPGYFGISCDDFHTEMIRRQKYFPLSLNATSTHDTKRGEDARARLCVLSDLPELWSGYTRYWHKANRRFIKIIEGREIPNRNDEYFIYQTIIGFMPVVSAEDNTFEERLLTYITKSLREGKTESDWSEPDQDYENNTHNFIHSILSDNSEFLTSLKPFLEKVAWFGILNSISQTLLKFTAPGVPDIYQGSETWNFSFVDPDNRRPVDFDNLHRELKNLKKENKTIGELFSHPDNPAIKILLTNLLLVHRNNHRDLYEKGEYIPLILTGKLKNRVLAYARSHKETTIIVAIPLNPGEFFDNKKPADIGAVNWKDTMIEIPDFFPSEYEDLLTDGSIKAEKNIYISDLFSEIPFGLLKGYRKTSEREAGILLHITSLPGRYPIGDLGPEAYNFADFLKRNGQSCWQILPLNQVYEQGGWSPYSPLSAFAGNICLVSPELLAEQNMISILPEKLKSPSSEIADYQIAEHLKEEAFKRAFKYLKSDSSLSLRNDFMEFREKEKYWLHDYSLFITIKKKYNHSAWNKWPITFRDHDKRVLKQFTYENFLDIEREEFAQFIFLNQWKALKSYCNDRGIEIFGDMPIYVNYDSADVWSHPEYFKLKENKEMLFVAGVPPDYFSKSGQLWNMPVYKWDVMENDKYKWWKYRIKKNLELFDILRLDHFRGFSAYWEVPAGEMTAVNGKWVTGPGITLFEELKKEFPQMPFVAEDLGEIDQPVYDLRDRYNLPGMKVLQFAFDTDTGKSPHLPHNYNRNCIVYTGTHDNNTTRGWFRSDTDKAQRQNLKRYLGIKIRKRSSHLQLIRLAYSSVARLAIIPLQDMLGLGPEGRMNIPSSVNGNWLWRLSGKTLNSGIESNIRTLVKTFGRK